MYFLTTLISQVYNALEYKIVQLERTYKGHQVQLDEQGCLQLHQVLRAWPSLTLAVSRGWTRLVFAH